eukprot:CAMPEP_0173430740 /NCGR_PEP_ID=MMETSP1357-20121228/9089_1 /TAXON_ID=77926 /ORGANISM="Hemiselmis rufescens, Strain PCC563" /LENGTH=239 /DNA_ID=CAMNT_0014395127 /DNA_START=356 /DNA_END=1072 /DNA_ORIENTATION=+
MPFVIVSLPAVCLTIASWWVIVEPERGVSEEGLQQRFEEQEEFQYRERITPGKACGIFAVPSNFFVFFQGIPGCLPWAVIVVFLNDFLTQDKGLTVQASTLVLTALNVGGCFGAFFGGVWGQMCYNWRRHSITLLMGGSTLLGIFPIVYLVTLAEPLPPLWAICVVAFLGGFIGYITGPNVRAILLNVNAPETRGTAFAVYNLMDHLGTGLGPGILVLFMSATGDDRKSAFISAVVAGW